MAFVRAFALCATTAPTCRARRMLGFERGGAEQLPLLRKDAMGGSQSSAASDPSFTPLRSDRDDATDATAAVAAGATVGAAADDAVDEAYDPNKQMVSLLKPVSLTMVLVVYLVRTLGSPASLEGGLSELMVYREMEADSASTKVARRRAAAHSWGGQSLHKGSEA